MDRSQTMDVYTINKEVLNKWHEKVLAPIRQELEMLSICKELNVEAPKKATENLPEPPKCLQTDEVERTEEKAAPAEEEEEAAAASSIDKYVKTNLQQRIIDVIKSRNGGGDLKTQVKRLDKVSKAVEEDPYKMLEEVGFDAVLVEDENNLPAEAVAKNEDIAKKKEVERTRLAMDFFNSEACAKVIAACGQARKESRFLKFFKKEEQ